MRELYYNYIAALPPLTQTLYGRIDTQRERRSFNGSPNTILLKSGCAEDEILVRASAPLTKQDTPENV